jgi:hypothetical protein
VPTFEVNVAGLGIRLPVGPGGREATSFARLVFFVAPDERSAEDKALTFVALDWNASRWARRLGSSDQRPGRERNSLILAERGRFELPIGFTPTPVFKTGAFNRSATSPRACNQCTRFYQAPFAFPCVIMRVGTVPEKGPRAPR